MHGVQINQCPFCGGTEFIHGKQSSYGAVYGECSIQACVMRHVICRNCGSIVHSYVDNPELLLKRKNRKNQ
ncbi:MAG: hypothetical protein PUB37_03975 [Firmicutes bacterium]|nr:hypothetical protein [Bacillota bacterium]